MTRQFIGLATVMASLFVGCTNQISSSAPLPSASNAESVIPVPEIPPGNRPKRIGDARFFSIEDYASARDDQKLSVGDLVCVEGRVKHAGERMGAAYLVFDDAANKFICSCEGEGLRRYHINPGSNVLVLGRIFDAKCGLLAEASLLTPSDIDAALASEHE